MSLAKLDLICVDLLQKETFQSAIGTRKSREALLVRWVDQEGRWGIGECSARPDPYFSHEYLAGVETVIADHIFPALPQQGIYADVLKVLSRVRGWGFARATVLAALHDLWQRNGLDDPLAAWPAPRLARVPVGISLGLYTNIDQVIAKVGEALDEGYQRVKLKIGPGMDPDYLASIRKTFPDAYLGCDANGSFDDATMHELDRLVDLNLCMLEQPFRPDRLDLCATLKKRCPDLKICLDEGVYEFGHLEAALSLGAIDELNIKPGRLGGIPTSIALANRCQEVGIPVWIGGMFETGIGRALKLRFAACFPNARAHDLSPSSRYFVQDLVTQPVVMDANGTIATPTEPVRLSFANLDRYTVRITVKRKD